ncbi:hypothetical protein GCM10009117_11480 [Gangjinia marincola]|uniref:DoxX family protein n=1 Tax=Gangjinia marincola TaxID=578463 RepID=A0ABN1MGF6_9FLAO
MNIKVISYTTLRMIIGIFLVIHGFYNALFFSNFLNRLDHYFEKQDLFYNDFLIATAPLVPFEEFILGALLICGLFTKKVLYIATGLVLFFASFVLKANTYGLGMIYVFIVFISLILLLKEEYNYFSVDTVINKKTTVSRDKLG